VPIRDMGTAVPSTPVEGVMLVILGPAAAAVTVNVSGAVEVVPLLTVMLRAPMAAVSSRVRVAVI